MEEKYSGESFCKKATQLHWERATIHMSHILVSGLVNLETTVKVPGFPLDYSPIFFNFFGIDTAVSGVGTNLARAFTALGDNVKLVSLVGGDRNGKYALDELQSCGINTSFVQPMLKSTPQSVVLYDESGKREIHCDLKDLQDTVCGKKIFLKAMDECDTVALCNINFSRPYLKVAHDEDKTIATDVHVISDIHDAYNEDFMKYADILFLSDENLPESPESFVKEIADTYHNSIIAVGLGSKGSLLYVRDDKFIGRIDPVKPKKIVSTVGAGDSLFSAFLHYYTKTRDPYESMKKANLFASCKISAAGGAGGFVSEKELDELYNSTK